MSDDSSDRSGPRGFRIEVDPDAIEETLRTLRDRVRQSFTAGRYTKVRVSFRGRQLGPDLPLAIFLAGEGAAFWLLSPLGALLVNLGAKAVLDVEFIHDAEELVREGLDLFLQGDLDLAEARYREALARRPDDPSALYHLAVVLRITHRQDEARQHLHRAAMGPEGHPDVVKAAELLARMS